MFLSVNPGWLILRGVRTVYPRRTPETGNVRSYAGAVVVSPCLPSGVRASSPTILPNRRRPTEGVPSLTTLTDFSPEDLGVLNRTPTAVAMAAAYAEQDGALSMVREMRAGLTAAREA